MIVICQRLVFITVLLFQLSFADLLGRALERVRGLLSTAVILPEVADTRLSEQVCVTIYNGAEVYEICYEGAVPPNAPVGLGN